MDDMGVEVYRFSEGDVLKKDGVTYRIKTQSNKLLVILSEMEPGAETGIYQHAGEEVRIVLKGTIFCEVGSEGYMLEEGDTIWHLSTIPHKTRNVGTEKAVYITIGTPPSFMKP